MKMQKIILSLAVCLVSASAGASEGMFGYMYTAETTPAGHWEYEQFQTLRTGKARGEYMAVDLRQEFEFGITGNLQVAFYLNSSYLNQKNQYDTEDVSKNFPDRHEFQINGTSVEFLYRVLSPYKDGMGLALYLEPEINVRDRKTGEDVIERAFEGRLILQKNFLGDRLMTVGNVMVEPEWVKESGLHKKELYMELTAGFSYRLMDKWFAGLEYRNHMEFPEFNLGNQEHSAHFVGPTVHYAEKGYWWTLTVLPQVSGWPRRLGAGSDGRVIADGSAHLAQHEKLEVMVKFGIPLTGEGHSHGVE